MSKLDFEGNCTYNDELYPNDREQLDETLDALFARIRSMDSLSLVVLGRVGSEVQVEHLLLNPSINQRFVEARFKSASIQLPNIDEVDAFMETVRSALHVDINEFGDTGSKQLVLDIGNSEGEGKSLQFKEYPQP